MGVRVQLYFRSLDAGEILDRIDRAAALDGLSRSQFMLLASRDRADQLLKALDNQQVVE